MNEALNNLLTRRSCRAYQEKQIKPEELDAILEAGTFAATGMGKPDCADGQARRHHRAAQG